MSGFDPSVLERKDRDELSQIAESLGQKPPSRARKADIVDLILRLAGVVRRPRPRATARPPADAAEPAPVNGAAKTEPPERAERAPRRRASGAGRAAAPATTPGGGRAAEPEPEPRADAGDGTAGADDGADERPNERSPEPQAPGPEPVATTAAAVVRTTPSPATAGAGAAAATATATARSRTTPSRASRSTSRASSTCATRATASSASTGYLPSKDDVYVSVKQVRQFGLRKGDHLKGASRPASRNEKNPALLRIDAVNGDRPRRGPAPARGSRTSRRCSPTSSCASSWPTTRPT